MSKMSRLRLSERRAMLASAIPSISSFDKLSNLSNVKCRAFALGTMKLK